MNPKIHVVPRTGLKVRTRNGEASYPGRRRAVGPDTYYRRRIAAGDLVVMTDAATAEEAKVVPTLKDVLGTLEEGNPAHWTEASKRSQSPIRCSEQAGQPPGSRFPSQRNGGLTHGDQL